MKVREVISYQNHFEDFLKEQPEKVQDKIFKIIEKIKSWISFGKYNSENFKSAENSVEKKFESAYQKQWNFNKTQRKL